MGPAQSSNSVVEGKRPDVAKVKATKTEEVAKAVEEAAVSTL